MNVKKDELREKLVTFAESVVDNNAAEYFANEIIETYIRKAPRTDPIKSAISDIKASIKNRKFKPEVVIDLGAYYAMDFYGHGPLAYIKQIHDDLENRSKKNGVAMLAFRNSNGIHTLHAWVQGLAKRGLVAIISSNGGPAAVVPFNGTKGLFGTNPIAYGFPGHDGEIHCIDMATSEIPYFEIIEAYKNGQSLKERSAVDNSGEFTSNASEALDFSKSKTDPVSNIVPMGGGYKGYYLVYMLELLTSGLIGMPSSAEMSSDFTAEEHGAILIVFHTEAMGTADKLQTSVGALHKAIKQQKPKQGKEILVPGEHNNKKLDNAGTKIEIADAVWQELVNFVNS